MSATRLLVLGAVRQHGRAHGYQVRNDLEFWGAHEWSNAKPGSIYHALKQMAKQGLLIEHDTAPSTAGGPPRTEYELTGEGEREFFALLREALLRHDERPDMLTAGVGFLVDLPRDEAISLLRQRVAALEAWREEVGRHWTPQTAAPEEWGHIGEIMKLWTHEAESSAAWTRGLIERLEAGAYVMAGEGERSLDVLPAGTENPYADRSPDAAPDRPATRPSDQAADRSRDRSAGQPRHQAADRAAERARGRAAERVADRAEEPAADRAQERLGDGAGSRGGGPGGGPGPGRAAPGAAEWN